MRRMCKRDGISLDTINSKCSSVKQDVYNVIIKQVDFIYVEETAICRCQQPRSEVTGAACQGRCKVKSPGNAIFAGIEWKSNQMYGALIDRESFVLFIANLAVVTHPLRGGWITEIRAVSYADNRGEQTCKSAYSCRFACASTSTDKDTPYRWIDGVENEGKSHVLLPNYSTQRECCHVSAFVDYST